MNSLDRIQDLQAELRSVGYMLRAIERQLDKDADSLTGEDVRGALVIGRTQINEAVDAWTQLTYELIRRIDSLETDVLRFEHKFDILTRYGRGVNTPEAKEDAPESALPFA